MKSITGQKTEAPRSGAIPTQHDLVPIRQSAEFQNWLDSQLGQLEDRFSDFVTVHAALSDIATGRC